MPWQSARFQNKMKECTENINSLYYFFCYRATCELIDINLFNLCLLMLLMSCIYCIVSHYEINSVINSTVTLPTKLWMVNTDQNFARWLDARKFKYLPQLQLICVNMLWATVFQCHLTFCHNLSTVHQMIWS